MADAAFQPDWFSKPGDTLCTLMVRRKLSPAMLAERMGRDVALIHGLLAGAVDIDTRIAVLLANSVGGSPSFWKMRQRQLTIVSIEQPGPYQPTDSDPGSERFHLMRWQRPAG